MRKPNILLIVSLLAIPTLVLLSGCQENQASSGDVKMNKLLAEENIRFETELANRDKVIFDQLKSLEKCGQEKIDMQKENKQMVDLFVEQIIKELETKVAKLEEENETLKTEIEKLR